MPLIIRKYNHINKIRVFVLIASFTASLCSAAYPAFNTGDGFDKSSKDVVAQKLINKADKTNKKVLVSVGFDTGNAPAADETGSQRAERYRNTQYQIIGSLPAGSVKAKRLFRFIPFMSLWVDAHAIKALSANKKVKSISEIVAVPPSLSESTVIIRATDAWSSGATGSGQTVAILDTGVQSSHPFLDGKVVSEACFSTSNGSVQTACPDGTTAQIGTGAGEPLPSNVYGYYHGTHVAGIAAGGTGSGLSGVAPGAKIISIQVFSIESDSNVCSSWGMTTPCSLSYSDDQIAALEQIYSLRTQFNVASANLSLGGGQYTSYCDSTFPDYKNAIDLLRTINVATAIASGNSGYTNAISAPACISSAISVGATTKSDTIAYYSNSASIIDLLAPGDSIYSSIPTSTYASLSGTSMATPHVAGAFAILKGANPNLSISTLQDALIASGKPILDTRNNITKPRIDVMSALTGLTSAWSLNTVLTPPANFAGRDAGVPTGWNYGARFVDFDGDGRTDLLVGHYNYGTVTKKAWRNTSTGWVEDPSYAPPVYFSGRDASAPGGWDHGARFVDLDGDGLMDLVIGHYNYGSSLRKAWRNTGTGWEEIPGFTPPAHFAGRDSSAPGGWDYGARMVDLNGDGLVDFLVGHYNYGSHTRIAWLNTGSGWLKTAEYAPTVDFAGRDQGAPWGWNYGARLADVDGDGLIDLLVGHYNYGSHKRNAWLNSGSGWVEVPAYAPAVDFAGRDGSATGGWDYGARLVDLNGDGLTDLIVGHYNYGAHTRKAWLSTGAGWVENPSYAPAVDFAGRDSSAPSGWDYGARLADLNGDGLPELLVAHYNYGTGTKKAWINSGGGWELSLAYAPTTAYFAGRDKGAPRGWDFGGRLVDIDGDGFTDLLQGHYNYGTNYRKTWINTNPQ